MSQFLRSRFSRSAFLLVFIGSLLRFWQIGTAELWYDEIVTSWLGHLPIPQLIEATKGDVHPPLWYLIEWVVVHISGADLALRLPSALLSIAALVLFIHLAKRLAFSDDATLVGLAFMALSPFQLYFGQEGRMYALLQFSILLGVLALLDRRWWLLSLCSIVIMYTHNYGLVYAAMLYVFAFILESRRPAFNLATWFGSGVIAVLCYLPWAMSLLAQFKSMDTWWQQPTTLGGFIQPLTAFIWGGSLAGFFAVLGAITSYILVLFALVRIVQLRSKMALALALFCFAPMLFSVATELVTHPTYLYRTFIGSSPALYLLLGWALTEQVDLIKRRIVLAVLVPMATLAVIFFYPTSQLAKWEMSQIDKQIDFQPGDIVYHMNSGSITTFWYRYPSRPEMWRYVSPKQPGDIGTLSSQTVKAMGVEEANIDDLPWKRAWLVYSTGPTMGIAEDQLVQKLVNDHAGKKVIAFDLSYSTLYSGGGLWLLKR